MNPSEILLTNLKNASPRMALAGSADRSRPLAPLGFELDAQLRPMPALGETGFARYTAHGRITTGIHEPTGLPARMVEPLKRVTEGLIQEVAWGLCEIVVTDRRIIGTIGGGGSPITDLGLRSGRMIAFSFDYEELHEISYERKRGLGGSKSGGFLAVSHQPGGSLYCDVKRRAIGPTGSRATRERNASRLMEEVSRAVATHTLMTSSSVKRREFAEIALRGEFDVDGHDVVARFADA